MLDIKAIGRSWSHILADERLLAGLAREVGHSLAAPDGERLRVLRNWLVDAPPGGERQQGFMLALVETIDGVRDGIAENEREATAWVSLGDGLHRAIVVQLAAADATTKDLSAALGKKEPEVSRALGRLAKEGLLDPPGKGLDRRYRVQRLSLRAKRALRSADATRASAAQPFLEPRLLVLASRPFGEIPFTTPGHRALYASGLEAIADLAGRPWTAEDLAAAEAAEALLAWSGRALRTHASNADQPTLRTIGEALAAVEDAESMAASAQHVFSYRELLDRLPERSALRLTWSIGALQLAQCAAQWHELFAPMVELAVREIDRPAAWALRAVTAAPPAREELLARVRAAPPASAELPDGLRSNLEEARAQLWCQAVTLLGRRATLRQKLEKALAKPQADRKLAGFWVAVMLRQPGSVQPRDVEDALEGFLRMPRPELVSDDQLAAIAGAVRSFAWSLAGQEDCVERVADRIASVSSRLELDGEGLERFDRALWRDWGWPLWACRALPNRPEIEAGAPIDASLAEDVQERFGQYVTVVRADPNKPEVVLRAGSSAPSSVVDQLNNLTYASKAAHAALPEEAPLVRREYLATWYAQRDPEAPRWVRPMCREAAARTGPRA